ncbi:hypothetical protein Cs7R123_40940 [Catellatospora sp. TT07R-123]|uniref:LCP family protein n=1 Tax=Catellatospora sp. TT07R-123 TaxID=2733863 RepID=UPI001B213330|nr:LCP family protein [Catellatospora sp. TT07R-123]GHJ46752.1 hypothetical protein Cs7R123_40940 [Catellatospora sp. TT07R-123]
MSTDTPDQPEAGTPKDDADQPPQRPSGRASVGRASVGGSTPPEGTPRVSGSSGRSGTSRPWNEGTPRGMASVPARGSASSRPGGSGSSRPGAAASSRGRSGSARVPVSGSGNTYGAAKKKIKPRWGRIALVAAVALALCAGLGLGGAWLYAKSVEGDLSRTDPFSALTGGRPAKKADGAMNILLVGSDSRDPDAPTDKGGEWRTDTIILMHVPASQDQAYLISMPRDLHVFIPHQATDPDCGTRKAKINAAYAWGGMPLLVKTVECFTSVRMDHVMLIDFGGFKDVVDALGGVDMNIERTITSIHKPKRTFTKGTMHLNGEEALDYARQRKQFPDGDFARMRHQQQLLKALLDKAASGGTLTNPSKLHSFLEAMTSAVTVDNDFHLVDMALQFRGIRSDNLTFMTSPHLGSQMVNGESVVVSDRPKAIELYQAVANDKVKEWVTAHTSPSPAGPGKS